MNGWYGVVVARPSGEILVGNHRYLAGVEEGLSTFPVQWVDFEDQNSHSITIADKRVADLATWDDRSLSEMLSDLPDLEGTGFSDTDLQILVASLEPPGVSTPPYSEARVRTDEVRVTIGPVEFLIGPDTFRAWYDGVTATVGEDLDGVIAEVRGRLGL